MTVISCIGIARPSVAQDAGAEARAYASFYGEGMRAYAEGRNDEAIASFYSAYALRPSPLLLKLIVRTHDFMGHCSAASRQRQHFESQHPDLDPPTLQICREPGRLEVVCDDENGAVVDDSFRVPCGGSISLPPGRHSIRSADGGPVDRVDIVANEVATARVRPRNPGENYEKVPILDDDERYLVIRSPDGLYQLWVRTPLRDDPDMMRGEGPGGFTILRGADGLYHLSSDELRGVDARETESESTE